MAESEVAKSAVKIIKRLDKLVQEATKLKGDVRELLKKEPK